jgi:hypothetical protein
MLCHILSAEVWEHINTFVAIDERAKHHALYYDRSIVSYCALFAQVAGKMHTRMVICIRLSGSAYVSTSEMMDESNEFRYEHYNTGGHHRFLFLFSYNRY